MRISVNMDDVSNYDTGCRYQALDASEGRCKQSSYNYKKVSTQLVSSEYKDQSTVQLTGSCHIVMISQHPYIDALGMKNDSSLQLLPSQNIRTSLAFHHLITINVVFN